MTVTSNSLLDGINRHVLAISTALNGRPDFSVAVCTVSPRGELHKMLELKGIKAYSLEAPNGHSPKIFKRFSDVLRDFAPDIVHAHVLALFERVILWALYSHVKIVYTYHGLGKTRQIERLLGMIFRINVSGRIYISEGVRAFYENCNSHRSHSHSAVIYNPIDVTPRRTEEAVLHASSLREEYGIASDVKIIGTACRIASIKRPEAFVSVMINVVKSNPKVCAVVIGDGNKELMQKIKSMVAEEDLAQRVLFTGYREDAARLIAEFDVFILTSVSEGMPTAVLEALTSGVPVVFCRGKGGLVDLEQINEECQFGYCVDKDDIEGLASNVECLLADVTGRYKSLSDNARLLCCERFSIEAISDKIANFYNSVMGD